MLPITRGGKQPATLFIADRQYMTLQKTQLLNEVHIKIQ